MRKQQLVNKYVFTSVFTRNDWVQTHARPSQNQHCPLKQKYNVQMCYSTKNELWHIVSG